MSLAMRQLAFILSVFMASIGILNPLSAQWLEAGVTVGTSNYLGDLVEGTDYVNVILASAQQL